jgi:cytochrome b pre-mRNA-processing protein 3
MFGALFQSKSFRASSTNNSQEALYACALRQTRQPDFYLRWGVPDTFDGRFDLLLVHVFLILYRLIDDPRYNKMSQDVFDVMFRDMDQTLREHGIGDMGVPKHMKRMMIAFNGRMYTYLEAVQERDEKNAQRALEKALARNLYGTIENPDLKALSCMALYMQDNIKYLNSVPVNDVIAGAIDFTGLDMQERKNG